MAPQLGSNKENGYDVLDYTVIYGDVMKYMSNSTS